MHRPRAMQSKCQFAALMHRLMYGVQEPKLFVAGVPHCPTANRRVVAPAADALTAASNSRLRSKLVWHGAIGPLAMLCISVHAEVYAACFVSSAGPHLVARVIFFVYAMLYGVKHGFLLVLRFVLDGKLLHVLLGCMGLFL